MKNKRIVIGLTGRFGAGCSATGEFFASQLNFSPFSLSNQLEEIACKRIKGFKKKQYAEKREIQQNLGDELRKKDPPVLVRNVLRKIKQRNLKKIVIETLRNPAEAKLLKDVFGDSFFLLGVDATIEARWSRLKHIYNNKRKSFDKNDRRDEGKGQPPWGQQVKKCLELADILINSEENFYIKSKKTKKIKKNKKAIDRHAQKLFDYHTLIEGNISRKPFKEELYMHHACSLALMSECLRRQVGAVIIRDGYIIAAGCNNVPKQENSCEKEFMNEREKCYRRRTKNNFLDEHLYCKNCGKKLIKGKLICNKCKYDNAKFPGKLLDICRSVHAEEAAIIQAANLGSTSLKETTLYTSTFPCMLCCKKIIDVGIKKVVYFESYPMDESLAIPMFKNAGINVIKYEGVTSAAFNRLFKRYF